MLEEKPTKRVKEEIVKENSNYLRGTIKEELKENTIRFNDDANLKLLKFHGIYQQDNRDSRQGRIANNLEKEYSFMVRTKLPGGVLTPAQYIGLNIICDKYSNKTLRITTRQTIQFHGIIKGSLQETLNKINENLILTYGACGDVVRNVMACPVCDIDPRYSVNLNEYAKQISDHLLPNTSAYYEIWVDEEKVDLSTDKSEVIYGKTYLPRKFKIGLALPEDNCIDLFTQDVGVVGITGKCHPEQSEGSHVRSFVAKAPQDDIIGFNLLVGGGLGHNHNKPETYPRLASELGFVEPEKLINTLEKIVTIQRDFGSRENRRHARMKYLIDDRGIDWFKNELEKRMGYKLGKLKEIKEYKACDHLGWHKQKDGLWYLGLFIENGRILDDENRKIKSGLLEIVEKYKPDVRLTPHQNLILININEKDKSEIDIILEKSKIYRQETVSNLRRNSIACVALPTCGLALAEAERELPGVIDELEKLGFKDEILSIRMSGCPNSCSRAPVSELGFIGTSANQYNIYLGGDFEGTKLNKIYKQNISGDNLVSEIAKLLNLYRNKRNGNEKFGDFCNRVGLESLK